MKNNNLYGYSLLEMLVTLVVFAVLLTMIVQVLVLSIDSGRKIALRSRIRGDLSSTAVMIRRDFRNSTKIDETKCSSSVADFNNQPACVFTLAGTNFVWVLGDDVNGCVQGRLCKLKNNGVDYELYFESPETLVFDSTVTNFELEVYEVNDVETQGLLLATLQADASNPDAEVPTQIRQVAVFTRNF